MGLGFDLVEEHDAAEALGGEQFCQMFRRDGRLRPAAGELAERFPPVDNVPDGPAESGRARDSNHQPRFGGDDGFMGEVRLDGEALRAVGLHEDVVRGSGKFFHCQLRRGQLSPFRRGSRAHAAVPCQRLP